MFVDKFLHLLFEVGTVKQDFDPVCFFYLLTKGFDFWELTSFYKVHEANLLEETFFILSLF